MLRNLYITPMLLDTPSPQANIWHPNDRSEIGYAQDFIQSYAILWERDPSAIRFLRELHAELAPKIERILTLRKTMTDWQDQRYDHDFKARWKALTDQDEAMTGGAER